MDDLNILEEHDSKEQDAVLFVAAQSEQKLASWLLRGFASSNFEPLQLHIEPNAATQLRSLFARLDPAAKERFKEATIRAVIEWTPSHKPLTLLLLASLAAYIRASGVIDELCGLIRNECLKPLEEKEYVHTVAYLIAVVQGFAPLESVKNEFQRLFFSPDFDPRFATQLFLGLCECDPEGYPSYARRFLQFITKHPYQYSLMHATSEFVRLVTWPRISENIQYLDQGFVDEFLELLCSYPWSPAVMLRERGGTDMIAILGPDGTISQTFPINVHHQAYETVKDREFWRNGEVGAIGRMLGIRDTEPELVNI